MQKKYLLLSLTSIVAAGAVFALSISNSVPFLSTASTGTQWNHYEAVSATCDKYGIKEYWTDCKGNTTIVEPIEGQMIEKGQPSAEDIQYIVDTYGAGDERIIAKSDVHGSGVESADCLGKEVCSVCGETLGGVDPTIDFTSNLYGAYDVYQPWGAVAQDGWVRADNAGQISFVNYTAGDICEYHLPKIYFAGFDSVTIDVTVQYNLVLYALDDGFSSSFEIPFNGYSLKVVFENISSSSMTVKILDAFSTVQVQSTCTDADILNGDDNFVLYVKGSGNVAWDALSNFTFVA